MSVSYPTKLYLAMKSGNICAFDDCKVYLTSEGDSAEPAVIGEAAHIYGENPGTDKKPPSARYREDMTGEKRNHYDNLIYLCPTCHTKIDKQEKDYLPEYLFELKEKHEAWVSEQLDQAMNNIGFAELEIALKGISGLKGPINITPVIPPSAKIKKNGLSSDIHALILMGLSRGNAVNKYLRENDKLNVGFADRLTNGFKKSYDDLQQKNLSGDQLFMEMLNFASGNNKKDFKIQAAGLAILSHLFEICEVFKR